MRRIGSGIAAAAAVAAMLLTTGIANGLGAQTQAPAQNVEQAAEPRGCSINGCGGHIFNHPASQVSILVTDSWFADGRPSSTTTPPGAIRGVPAGTNSRAHYFDADAFYAPPMCTTRRYEGASFQNLVGTYRGPVWVKVTSDVTADLRVTC